MTEYTTADAVASHIRLAAADALCAEVAAAVNSYLDGRDDLVDVDTTTGTATPKPAAMLGATMLAAKLHRRRNSPGGTESVDGTVASYVARYDPDISRLLRIDYHSAPGIA